MRSHLHSERETGLADDVEPDPLQGDVASGQVTLEHVSDEGDEDDEEDS